MRSYRADNPVDDTTINLPDFAFLDADSPSPGGAVVPGSSQGIWIDGFGIERPALPIDISNESDYDVRQPTTGLPLPEDIEDQHKKVKFVEKLTRPARLCRPHSVTMATFGASCVSLGEEPVALPTVVSVSPGVTSSAGGEEDEDVFGMFDDGGDRAVSRASM